MVGPTSLKHLQPVKRRHAPSTAPSASMITPSSSRQLKCSNGSCWINPHAEIAVRLVFLFRYHRYLHSLFHYPLSVISALVGSSGTTGFSAFLPARGKSPSSSHPNAPLPPIQHLPVALSSILSFSYPSDPYYFSLRLIHRYSYVLGGTPSVFFGATGAAYAKTHLIEVDRKNDTVLLCINDDLVSTDPKEVKSLDDVLKAWMDGRWPDRMGIERVGEVNQGTHQRAELCV